jgi:hypothetical protein
MVAAGQHLAQAVSCARIAVMPRFRDLPRLPADCQGKPRLMVAPASGPRLAEMIFDGGLMARGERTQSQCVLTGEFALGSAR